MKRNEPRPLLPLERLSRLKGFTIDKHQVDPRGWTVVSPGGHPVGKVEDLVVDTSRMVASYLEVDLDPKVFSLRHDATVLVPLNAAERDGTNRRLIVSRLTPECVAELESARARHDAEFWNGWWAKRPATVEDLRAVLADVKVGEEVRIPVGDEELVIERRPAGATTTTMTHPPEPAPPAVTEPRLM